MNTPVHGSLVLRAGALSAALIICGAQAFAQYIPTPVHWSEAAPGSEESWVSFSGGYVEHNGADGAYQRLRQHEDVGFGGIDEFRYKRTTGDSVLLMDGKLDVGDGEYRLHARLNNEAKGFYVDGGFKQNRVFYDISGGYFPLNGAWFPIWDDEGFVDRTELWLEGGLVKEQYTLRLRASRQERDGLKDSTMWGDTALTGGSGNRNIVPSYWNLDETRNVLTADLEYRQEATTYGAGLRYEETEIENSRHFLRRPREGGSAGNQQRYLTTRDISETDLFASRVSAEHRRGENLIFTGAASYTKLDTNLSGTRIFGGVDDPAYDRLFPRGSTDHGYIDLHGDANWHQYVIVGNVLYLPAKNWRVTGGLRYENQKQDAAEHFIETAGNLFEEALHGDSERDFDEILGSVEASYTGVENWVMTGFFETARGDGELFEEGGTSEIDRDTQYDRNHWKYGVNARWYPTTSANFAVGAYHRIRDNDYHSVEGVIPGGDVAPTNYPAFITAQKLSTDDLYFRATWRPGGGVSIVGRYDLQKTDIESRQFDLNTIPSAELESHIISGSVNWTPLSRLVIQVGVNYSDDQFITGTLTAPSIAPLVTRFDNDYFTGNALVMFVVDEMSDLQVDAYRFESDNLSSIASFTQPYGLTATDRTYGATYTRRASANLQWSVRYAYSEYDDLTSGGHRDFDAHLLYGRVQLRF